MAERVEDAVGAHTEPLGEAGCGPARLVQAGSLGGLLVIEAASSSDAGTAQMSGDSPPVDTEHGSKIHHRPARPIATDQSVDLGGFQ